MNLLFLYLFLLPFVKLAKFLAKNLANNKLYFPYWINKDCVAKHVLACLLKIN